MNGYFALVTRHEEAYRVNFPDLDIDHVHSDTVEAALHEAKRSIASAVNDNDDVPDPRPSTELMGEATRAKAVAAVCVTP